MRRTQPTIADFKDGERWLQTRQGRQSLKAGSKHQPTMIQGIGT